MAKAFLKKHEGRFLKSGGSWIFDNEIARVEGPFVNGDILDVSDFDGFPLGKGYINMHSKIRIRMLTRDPDAEISDAFLAARLRTAWDYRKQTVDTSSCRVVFGEADFLPGLVIDKYGDVLVIESLALGMDRLKVRAVSLLRDILAEDGIRVRGVYERSDSKERLKEGLDRISGFIGDEFDTTVRITENGVKYDVDVRDGQKTGFFLDQKYNRKAIQKLAPGARVLDCFTHTGSFALNAAAAGAASVLALDASESALRMAAGNAALNGFRQIAFEKADLMEWLPEKAEEGRQYDLIILDPPAFAKSKANVRNALRGYREINRCGMKMLRNGGWLATCSCSRFVTRDLFENMLREAARDAHVQLRLAEARAQSPDHPVLWPAEETWYLKFYIFQVLRRS